MITVEEKLEIFHKIVYREEEEKFQKALKELEEMNLQALEDRRKELESHRDEIVRRKISMAKIERNEAMAKAIEKNKAQLRQKRKDLQDQLLREILKKADQFVDTDEYYEYLCENINKYLKEFENNEVVVYVREKDKESIKGCIKGLVAVTGKSFVIETMSDDKIGGFVISNSEKTYNIDHSLKTLIEEKEYTIGQRLCLALGKAGENVE
ncbi:V-type ATP synthase subunit E family protein [Gudongella oleilytica]|uniref:V-type ATP synthase subunit E n=1 Tax=Gudongella oleilytica TaxID=1582259 RepID=UPI002A3646BA|nr:V-type ATP synthase subunit E family protein [Gudongella oleilytica]MDY0257179.1 V-type ATP synthase subunit E family protein [Gudongella oleilytica]